MNIIPSIFCPRWLFAFLALVLSVSASALAANPVTLNIHLADGTVQSVQLYTRPQVTFEDDRVVFTSPVATFSYDAKQVLRFTYSGIQSDKASFPQAKDLFRQQGEQLLFDPSVKTSAIHLFTEDGRRLPVSLVTSNGRPSLSLKSLPAGVYVLSVNGQTSKLMK